MKDLTKEEYQSIKAKMAHGGFKVYASGVCSMSVCADNQLSVDEIEMLANIYCPTETESEWEISKDKFRDGKDNPCPCDQNPDTHKHYLLNY